MCGCILERHGAQEGVSGDEMRSSALRTAHLWYLIGECPSDAAGGEYRRRRRTTRLKRPWWHRRRLRDNGHGWWSLQMDWRGEGGNGRTTTDLDFFGRHAWDTRAGVPCLTFAGWFLLNAGPSASHVAVQVLSAVKGRHFHLDGRQVVCAAGHADKAAGPVRGPEQG